MAVRSRWVSRLLAAGVMLLTACGDPALDPSTGDDVPEVTLSGATLLTEYTRAGDYYVSPRLPALATQVGAMWQQREATSGVRLEARGEGRDGAGLWLPLDITWNEDTRFVARTQLGVVTTAAQVRIAAADVANLVELTWSAVVPEPQQEEIELPTATGAPLLQLLVDDGVKTRADWGARPPTCASPDASKSRMAIHHTAGSPGTAGTYAQKLREIQAYHMDTRGWCDIGYHFVVSIDGTAWEARELSTLGAHVLNYNRFNVGISLMGCYHPTADCAGLLPNVPSQEMIDRAGRLAGLVADYYDFAITDTSLKGHRDWAGTDSTSCPGDNVWSRLPEIRAIAAPLVHIDNPLPPPPPCDCDVIDDCDEGCNCDAACACDCDVSTVCDDACACDPECPADEGGCFNSAARPKAEATSAMAFLFAGMIWRRWRRR